MAVLFSGDRYDEDYGRTANGAPRSGNKGGTLDDIEEWDRGSKKSVAQEAIGKVKDLWNRTRGFDEPPEYGYATKCPTHSAPDTIVYTHSPYIHTFTDRWRYKPNLVYVVSLWQDRWHYKHQGCAR